jgi:hypothetical protein
MNASDITKKRQYCTLQNTYQPTIFQSTSFQNIQVISSILDFTGPLSTLVYRYQFASTNVNVPQYTCTPTFISYETVNQINPPCHSITNIVETQWKPNQSTLIYAYSTMYGTGTTPSTVYVTSTSLLTGPSPLICPADLYPMLGSGSGSGSGYGQNHNC